MTKFHSKAAIYLALPGFSYLVMPKAGCTSVCWAMAQLLGIRSGNWRERLIYSRARDPGAGPVGFSFTLVRDPVERAVSCWWDKTQQRDQTWMWADRYGSHFRRGMTLAEWTDAVGEIPAAEAEDHFAPQTAILDREGWPQSVGRLGDVAHWRRIDAETGLGPLPLKNRSAHREPIDPGVRRALAAYYADDYTRLPCVSGTFSRPADSCPIPAEAACEPT